MKKEVLTSLETAENLYKSAKKNSISAINDFMADLTDSGAKDLLIEFKNQDIVTNGFANYGYIKYNPKGIMLLTISTKEWVPLFTESKDFNDLIYAPNDRTLITILKILLTHDYNVITSAQLEYGRHLKWTGKHNEYEYVDFNAKTFYGDYKKRKKILDSIFKILTNVEIHGGIKEEHFEREGDIENPTHSTYTYYFKAKQPLTWINYDWLVDDTIIGIRRVDCFTSKKQTLRLIPNKKRGMIPCSEDKVSIEHLENILAVLQEELKN